MVVDLSGLAALGVVLVLVPCRILGTRSAGGVALTKPNSGRREESSASLEEETEPGCGMERSFCCCIKAPRTVSGLGGEVENRQCRTGKEQGGQRGLGAKSRTNTRLVSERRETDRTEQTDKSTDSINQC